MPHKIAGYGVAIDRETGKTVDEHDSMQCCHCGHHFRVRPGSGKTRGFCLLCGGVTCGAQGCYDHWRNDGRSNNFNQQLDDYEAGKLIVLK